MKLICKRLRKILSIIKWKLQILQIAIHETKGMNWISDADQQTLESNLLLTAHALEKGMGVRFPRKGFGQEKAVDLIFQLQKYIDLSYPLERYAFLESASILESYIKFHEGQGNNIKQVTKKYEFFYESLDVEIKNHIKMVPSGIEIFKREELYGKDAMPFGEFVRKRHSIRAFSKDCVSEEIIVEALNIAKHSPSACNRQPIYAYYSSNQCVNNKIDDIVPGNNAFKGEISNFMVITAEKKYFSGSEGFQWFVNGGIFLAYLTLAFHSLDIGSCVFQWPVGYTKEKELRQLLQLPRSHTIVSIVGFGYYLEENKCLMAYRKKTDDILCKVE